MIKKQLAILWCLLALGACTPSQQERAKNDVDDALIATQVKAKVAAIDPATVSLVQVDVVKHAVTLTGQVHSSLERIKVEEAARSVPNVTTVDDRLIVNPKAPTANEIADDLSLQTKVKAALAAQTGVNALNVRVSSHAGVVLLEGTVASKTVHDLVLETASGVKGVRRVVDHVRIERS